MAGMSAAAEAGVLCVGRIYCDLVFTGVEAMPTLGHERFARALDVTPGGGAFITAAHLAGLGRRAALVARLGLDPISQALEPVLAATGVDLAHVERAADAGPQVTVVVVQDGDRAFLSRRAGEARPATLQAALRAPRARHLHIAEYATLVEIPELVGAAKAAGLTVSLDPSWDDTLIASPRLLEDCRGVDVFLPNAVEATTITGCATLDEAATRLAAHFPVVVVKNGGEGATAIAGPERLTLPAPAVPVVDTTGAGDAFDAGFLDRWLAGAPLGDCLAAGIARGSLSVQTVGGA